MRLARERLKDGGADLLPDLVKDGDCHLAGGTPGAGQPHIGDPYTCELTRDSAVAANLFDHIGRTKRRMNMVASSFVDLTRFGRAGPR